MVDQAPALPETTEIVRESAPQQNTTCRLIVSKKLGDGAQAKVYKAHIEGEDESASFAVKVFAEGSLGNANGAPEKEYEILQQLYGHPNVLKADEFVRGNGTIQIPRNIPRDEYDTLSRYRQGFETEEKASYMKMELCQKDLFDVIANKGSIQDESLLRYLFEQISNSVDTLHTKAEYAHLDLKLENILVGNDYKLKLCDFGFAQEVQKELTTKYGTESYMAPEIETRQPGETYKGVQADIFSLGVILFTLKFGAPPCSRASPMDRNYSILMRKPEAFWKLHPSVKKYVNTKGPVAEDLIDLLTSMLSSDLKLRPASIEQVLSHPYFKNSEEKDVDALNEQFKQLV